MQGLKLVGSSLGTCELLAILAEYLGAMIQQRAGWTQDRKGAVVWTCLYTATEAYAAPRNKDLLC